MSPVDIGDLQAATFARDADAAELTRERLDGLVKPVGSLGRLEELAAWLAGAQGQSPPRPLERVRVVVLAGDHGIARAGVSAYPPEVTAAMVRTFVSGRAGVSVLARQHGVGVRVLDLGVDADLSDLGPEVTRFKVRRGSGSIDREDGLTPEELDAAFSAGMTIADEEVDAGADLLIVGDMGIGNTTVAAALVGAALGLTPLEVVGSGTGVDDDAWARKVAALRDAMHRARSYRVDGMALLRTLGSPDTAAMTGLLLQAAVRRTPVLLDGVVSCACALVGRRMVEDSRHWWLAGHRSTEPAQHRVLDVLDLEPLVDLKMRLGEGTGALVALPLLRSAQALTAEMGLLADVMPEEPASADGSAAVLESPAASSDSSAASPAATSPSESSSVSSSDSSAASPAAASPAESSSVSSSATSAASSWSAPSPTPSEPASWPPSKPEAPPTSEPGAPPASEQRADSAADPDS